MSRPFRYADLWRFLGDLGFDCATVRGGARVCEHKPSETLIVLGDHAADEAVHEQILVGVQLQLDSRGLLSRKEFDRRVARGAGASGGNGVGRPRKSRRTISGGPA